MSHKLSILLIQKYIHVLFVHADHIYISSQIGEMKTPYPFLVTTTAQVLFAKSAQPVLC